MSTLVHVSSPPVALTSKGKSAPLNNAFAYHDMSQNADMYYVYFSFNVHILRTFMEKKTRGFLYKTRIMARLIEKVMKGGSLKYIKYKKYFMQRAKI